MLFESSSPYAKCCAQVFANDAETPLIEYGDPDGDPHGCVMKEPMTGLGAYIKQCFVAVKDGDVLTIRASINGSYWRAAMLFVVDGVSVKATHVPVPFENGHGFSSYCGSEPSWFGSEPSSSRSYQGTPTYHVIRVKPLKHEDQQLAHRLKADKFNSGTQGVGCLAAVFSMTSSYGNHSNEFPPGAPGSWRSGRPGPTRWNAIQPQHELIWEGYARRKEGQKGKTPRRVKLSHKPNGTRLQPGFRPLVKLLFHYRTAEQIESAEYVPLDRLRPEPTIKLISWGIPGYFYTTENEAEGTTVEGRSSIANIAHAVSNETSVLRAENQDHQNPAGLDDQSEGDVPSQHPERGSALFARERIRGRDNKSPTPSPSASRTPTPSPEESIVDDLASRPSVNAANPTFGNAMPYRSSTPVDCAAGNTDEGILQQLAATHKEIAADKTIESQSLVTASASLPTPSVPETPFQANADPVAITSIMSDAAAAPPASQQPVNDGADPATITSKKRSRLRDMAANLAKAEAELAAKRQKRAQFEQKYAAMEKRQQELAKELQREDELQEEMGVEDLDDA